jgi:hypothetical protein
VERGLAAAAMANQRDVSNPVGGLVGHRPAPYKQGSGLPSQPPSAVSRKSSASTSVAARPWSGAGRRATR